MAKEDYSEDQLRIFEALTILKRLQKDHHEKSLSWKTGDRSTNDCLSHFYFAAEVGNAIIAIENILEKQNDLPK